MVACAFHAHAAMPTLSPTPHKPWGGATPGNGRARIRLLPTHVAAPPLAPTSQKSSGMEVVAKKKVSPRRGSRPLSYD